MQKFTLIHESISFDWIYSIMQADSLHVLIQSILSKCIEYTFDVILQRYWIWRTSLEGKYKILWHLPWVYSIEQWLQLAQGHRKRRGELGTLQGGTHQCWERGGRLAWQGGWSRWGHRRPPSRPWQQCTWQVICPRHRETQVRSRVTSLEMLHH